MTRISRSPLTRTMWAAACLMVVAAGLTAAVIWYYNYPMPHFQEVRQGVLYRSSQPDDRALEYLEERYHIRTIVNLRGANPREAWWQAEKGFCDRRGIKLFDIPLNQSDQVTCRLKEFLAIVTNPDRQPALVHCEAGSARTGFACAAYRIVIENWDYEDALDEAKRFRFKPQSHLNPVFDATLRSLLPGMDWQKLDSADAQTGTAAGADSNHLARERS